MNERIRALIIQTDEWLVENAQSERWEREQKFAELIVRECAELSSQYTDDSRIYDFITYQFGIE